MKLLSSSRELGRKAEHLAEKPDMENWFRQIKGHDINTEPIFDG